MLDHTDTLTLDLFADPHPSAGGSAPPTPPSSVVSGGGEGVPLELFAERAYLAYAMSVVKGRALPSVEDGQKPVQRRILYAMREMGNRSDAPFKKSARIVGDVIGKFHPHGDSAVYEAAVRMAQEFTLRYPLIEGQGNFGSRDGDSAAAMRYTEIRLSRFAEDVLLSELDRGTVDFIENYDGSMKEPALLPARLPVLLLNGATGIAVGMATDIPPHNLNEIAEACKRVVADPAIDPNALLDLVPAPDFPGGGQIISSSEDIRKAYATGRGSLRVRARWTVEALARGQWRIAVTELPPNTNAARVLSEIEELTNPKIKAGKKTLTQDQQNLKASVLAVLDSARDDSDGDHPVRLLLEPRSSRVTPEEMIAALLANTSLEGNVALNLVTIGRDGKPQQKGIAQILLEWADFRLEAVDRRLRHRLSEVEKRIHVLQGRMIAFLNIEAVIRVIREAEDPKRDLMARFTLTEIQADDILEIRLRQLARLEGIRIENELKALQEEDRGIRSLLANEIARRELVIREIDEDAARYGDPRRTLIEAAEKVTASRVETLADEPVTVILSKNGFVRARTGHGIDRAALAWKAGDGEMTIVETRTVHPVIFMDTAGRAYSVRAADIPGGKGDGVPVTSLADLQGRVTAMLSGHPDEKVLVAVSGGYGFIAKIADMMSRQKAGKEFLRVDEGETVLAPQVVGQSTHVLAASAKGKALLFALGEVKELPKGRGVVLMGLDDGDHLACAMPVTQGRSVAFAGKKGELVVEWAKFEQDFLLHRARKGRKAPGTLLSQVAKD